MGARGSTQARAAPNVFTYAPPVPKSPFLAAPRFGGTLCAPVCGFPYRVELRHSSASARYRWLCERAPPHAEQPTDLAMGWLREVERMSDVKRRRLLEGVVVNPGALRQCRPWSASPAYTPRESDVGHALVVECLIVDAGREVCLRLVTMPVCVHPRTLTPSCARRQTRFSPHRGLWRPGGASGQDLPWPCRVCSYNMLAQQLTFPRKYPHVPPYALLWPYRLYNLLRDIDVMVGNRDGDPSLPIVLCLQEVDASRWPELRAQLKARGFDGRFASGPRRQHGVAICFRALVLVDEHVVQYDDLIRNVYDESTGVTYFRVCRDGVNRGGHVAGAGKETLLPYSQSLHRVARKILTDRCALVLKLRHGSDPRRSACFCTTHLWHSRLTTGFNDAIRLLHINMLLSRLSKLVSARHASSRLRTPVVLSGDFNSTCHSAVYQLLSTGLVQTRNRPELARAVADPDWSRLLPAVMTHNLALCSAYAAVCGHEPRFRKRQHQGSLEEQDLRDDVDLAVVGFGQGQGQGQGQYGNFGGGVSERDVESAIDFVFLDSRLIRPQSVLMVPTDSHSIHRLPSAANASDHFPLAVDLQIGVPAKMMRAVTSSGSISTERSRTPPVAPATLCKAASELATMSRTRVAPPHLRHRMMVGDR